MDGPGAWDNAKGDVIMNSCTNICLCLLISQYTHNLIYLRTDDGYAGVEIRKLTWERVPGIADSTLKDS